ncbi:MAG: NifU family protein [Dehalococcoidia bacterium]
MFDRVQEILDAIRPSLQAHGGDVNLLDVTPEKIARLELTGACGGCPMASITLKLGIERVLAEEVPELAGVEAVNVDTTGWPGFEPE